MSASRAARRWWLGLAVMAVGAVWLHGAGSIASTTHFIGVGPAAMVTAVGAGLVFLGALLALQEWQGLAPRPDIEDPAGAFRTHRFLLALAGIGLPMVAMLPLGFPITAMGTFALVARAFGSRRLALDLAIGAVIGGGAWWGFSKLGVNLGKALPLLG